MNTTSRIFTVAIAVALGATALVAGIAGVERSATQPEIVKLERVVITGKRAVQGFEHGTEQGAEQVATIERLPRVVIEGRRAEGAVRIASACAAPARC